MSAHASPASSEVAADQPKDQGHLSEPLPESQPTSQDVNHGDHATTTTTATTDFLRRQSTPSQSPTSSPQSQESGEASPEPLAESTVDAPAAPPLPDEEPPATEGDDGWTFHWDADHQAYFFHNRFTGQSTWENPRMADTRTSTSQAPAAAADIPEPPKDEQPPAGGYNPAIHGDYDPNAWYAQGGEKNTSEHDHAVDASAAYAAIGSFNRFTERWQGADQNTERHTDEAKSRRQMNAFFDVDAAANSHDGRSLKAERSGKKPTKAELKQFKEKRKARKEEKRRAWLRD
ncbi:hypothetical protein AAE478_003069 [Parahypoxylon ruwenzoriense]